MEKKHKHLLETVRSLIFQSKLPLKYWGECILTTTYLINRFPSPLFHNKSPFELFYGSSPHFSHLQTFGCLCFTVMPKSYRDKFQSRIIPSVFISYSSGKKIYKLLRLSNHCIFYSRDILFHENVFPYSSSSTTHLFTPVPLFLKLLLLHLLQFFLIPHLVLPLHLMLLFQSSESLLEFLNPLPISVILCAILFLAPRFILYFLKVV